MDTIAYRDINEPVFSGNRDSGFRSLFREREESRAPPTAENGDRGLPQKVLNPRATMTLGIGQHSCTLIGYQPRSGVFYQLAHTSGNTRAYLTVLGWKHTFPYPQVSAPKAQWRLCMLTKRIIPCLDVRAGKVTKGIAFKGNVDIGDPVAMAKRYYEEGADEIVFYDITASSDRRDIMLDVVDRVAAEIFIPYSVGGGIRTFDDMRRVLLAGAEKVSVNTAAVLQPGIISQGAQAFGSQCVVLSMDVKRTSPSEKIPSGYEIVIHGGRTPMGIDAIQWAQRGEELGAGELVINSIDADGTQAGYEISLTRTIADSVGIPVIASGGGGVPEHLYEVFTEGRAEAAIIASMTHYNKYTIPEIKQYLQTRGVPVRRIVRSAECGMRNEECGVRNAE